MENPIFRCLNFSKLRKSEFRYPDIFWKTSGYRNSLFRNFEKLRHRKIGFLVKFQLGYLENQFFTTLGGGVKHGIKISFEITKCQMSLWGPKVRASFKNLGYLGRGSVLGETKLRNKLSKRSVLGKLNLRNKLSKSNVRG